MPSNPEGRDSAQITGVVTGGEVAPDGELTTAGNSGADPWTVDSEFDLPVGVVDGSTADERWVEVDNHHRYGVANFHGVSREGEHAEVLVRHPRRAVGA